MVSSTIQPNNNRSFCCVERKNFGEEGKLSKFHYPVRGSDKKILCEHVS